MSRNTKDDFKVQFGNKKVSLKTLNKNKIALFTESGRLSLRHEMISDELKNIIKAIIKGQIFEVEEAVELLDDIDRKLLFSLLDNAQIDVDWGRSDDSKNQLIHRFNVLKDEIMLGNHGEDTLREFRSVIDTCYEKKMLSKSDYYRMKDLIITKV